MLSKKSPTEVQNIISTWKTARLPKRFEYQPNFDKFQWRLEHEHGISHFSVFLKNKNSLDTLIAIFVNSLPKGFSWQNIEKSDISTLSGNSWKLQAAALKEIAPFIESAMSLSL